jgi:uncharacterized membrane protein YoaK (UPF0700 family)
VAEPEVEIPRAAFGVAFPLATVAGYVDAVGFLTLAGLFVAHMSGNTVRLGVFVGNGDWSLAAQRLVPIVVFTLGVAGGIALIEAMRRRSAPAPAARVLGVEAVLLAAFMLAGRAVLDGRGAAPGWWDYYVLAVVVVLAMGVQNAALRRVAGVPVHTTFVTGILTHLAEESVNGWYAWRDLRREGGRRGPDDAVHTAFRRARLHGGVWLSYLGGGVLGAFLALHWDLWSLGLPIAALVVLIGVDLFQPREEIGRTAT